MGSHQFVAKSDRSVGNLGIHYTQSTSDIKGSLVELGP